MSDKPVGGAKGKRIRIPSAIGIPALESLQGMAVNVRSDLSGHAPTNKVGIIERAWTGDKDPKTGGIPVYIEGYLFEKDFPETVNELRSEQSELGFSYEVSAQYYVDGSVGVVTALAFTGATILYKEKAAYTNTRLAAEGDEELTEEQIKALIAESTKNYVSVESLTAASAKSEELSTKVTTLEAALNASTEKVTALETALTAATEKLATYETLAASVEEVKTQVGEVSGKIEPLVTHTEAIKAAAEEREKFTRRSSGPVSLMAKYQIEEQSDLKAELDVISKRSDLDVSTRIAMKMEAQARHAAKA